ncbi:stage II sporulation protein P [Paenibacillus soyae]|uniref:Stage II sporulation protein P n=1 Tax=Paenibacillus soyae TaxID=2969249 RepID=A0A9X2MN65_9BACL|nr:stage II sporulation protein P [Paenibacillus soyae]MCR2802741.1 stage II sporulation protein P [Paenibacillus soyae]
MHRINRKSSFSLKARWALSSGKAFVLICLASAMLFISITLLNSDHPAAQSLMGLNNPEPTPNAATELPIFLQQQKASSAAQIEGLPNRSVISTELEQSDKPDKPEETPSVDERQAAEESNKPAHSEPPKNEEKAETKVETKPETKPEPKVLVYHTHNRESFFPELKKGAKDASSSTKNITNVGKRLSEQLTKRGIGTIHSKTDYPTTVKGFHYSYSYKYSKTTVAEVMANTESVDYFLDLHRDSQKWKKTTVGIKGKNYAKVMFVIGQKNKNWKENEKLALRLDKLLNEKYPGISRGVLNKGPGTGNAEFNQSLSPNSLVVEVGGVDNSFEELNRTADALAEVMAILIAEES